MYTTPTNRRSVKRSPTSSPISTTFDSSEVESPTAQLGRFRPGPSIPNELEHDTSIGTEGLEPRHSLGSKVAGEEEEEVDGLIDRMQRNMRIVSSTSTVGRPRISELEANQVDGVLGEILEGEDDKKEGTSGSSAREHEQLTSGRPAPNSKALRSLRQPVIQPRMNKSTLARLNSSLPGDQPRTPNRTVLTPSRTESRRPISVAAIRSRGQCSPNETGCGNPSTATPGDKVRLRDGTSVRDKRRSAVITPASLKPPAITPRGTRSSDLRVTIIKNPSYFSPTIDERSASRLSALTPEEIKRRESKIFEGTPGHRRNLSLRDELWSLRPGTPHRTNRSADLRRDPTLAQRPATPSRDFKARPLPAMYGSGGSRQRDDSAAIPTSVEQDVEGARPKVKA